MPEEMSGKTEIYQFEVRPGSMLKKPIFKLEIPMHNTVIVKILYSREHFGHETSGTLF
jgi:hypothetical protein